MGTRGYIGFYAKGKTPGKVGVDALGVYNHFDSYPTGLLQRIVGVVQNNHAGDWEAFVKRQIKSRTGGFRDNSRDEKPSSLLNGKWDPLFIEWVYILHKDGIDVLAHRTGTKKDGLLGFKLLGKIHNEPGKGYGWWIVQENVPYTITTPYIEEMQERAYAAEEAVRL